MEKVCTKCKQLKDINCFGAERGDPHGRTHCKECRKIESKERYQKDKEKLKKYYAIRYIEMKEVINTRNKRYAQSERGKERIREKSRERRMELKNTPEYKARKQIGWRVEKGKILKPDKCEICGEGEEQRNIHGHHEDYSKPLEVVWCCPQCHSNIHKKS